MFFPDYALALYNCIGLGALHGEFVRELFLAITQSEKQDLVLDKSAKYLGKLYTGELGIKPLSQKIAGYIDRPAFAEYLSS